MRKCTECEEKIAGGGVLKRWTVYEYSRKMNRDRDPHDLCFSLSAMFPGM